MKKIKSNLAILGGHRIISKEGPHYKWPIIDKKIEKAVIVQLHEGISIYDRSGIFEKFENEFSKYHKKKFSLLCSSGTVAIHSMFVAAGLRAGDEVICPAYTFFATVTPLLFTGAKPVLADCDNNGNINPVDIERKITKKTKAVVITHMWGVPCQMDRILKICKKHKLLLLEDCSHAHGAKYKGRTLGSFGDISAWSLQGPKNVTGGEGGILVTDNKEFYYKALLLGHYNKRCKQEISKEYSLYKYATTGMGLKYRAHPLAIAIALEVFRNLNKSLKIREKFAKKIANEINQIEGLEAIFPKRNEGMQFSWYALIIKYDQQKFGDLPIDIFYDALKAEGLSEIDIPGSTSPLNFLPLFQDPGKLFPVYSGKNAFSYRQGDFVNAEKFYGSIIKLPVWASEKDEKIVDLYISGIKKVCKNYKYLLNK